MIVVVGSVNRDLVLAVEHHPAPGETVAGAGQVRMDGGKGANQAVAASRLGADVRFVGRVGADDDGRALIAAFAADGVDTDSMVVDEDLPTGLAVITVDAERENAIVVIPGANGRVSIDDVDAAAGALASAAVTLLQLEVPSEVVARAAQHSGGKVILNPAPARPLAESLLAGVDVLVPNRNELEILTGSSDPLSARDLPVPVTIVTLGGDGAALVRPDGLVTLPAPSVEVVDTTGAGDAFCGALAVGLDRGDDIEAAARTAVAVGAMAVTAVGARAGMPTTTELATFLRR